MLTYFIIIIIIVDIITTVTAWITWIADITKISRLLSIVSISRYLAHVSFLLLHLIAVTIFAFSFRVVLPIFMST